MNRRSLVLLLAAVLSLTACGPKAAAATMHLKRTEGTVSVADGAGKAVKPREDLGLYSGYGVDTQFESYAWIELDRMRLTKLDQNSGITITKKDGCLEIEVQSGSLFFSIDQPLEEDEEMNIRASTMAVGIRGTCGWVERPDENSFYVYILEGRVECSAGAETALVEAGQMASMAESGEIVVSSFSADRIPAFVQAELEGQEDPGPAGPEGPAVPAGEAGEDMVFNNEYVTLGEGTVGNIEVNGGGLQLLRTVVVNGNITLNGGYLYVGNSAVVNGNISGVRTSISCHEDSVVSGSITIDGGDIVLNGNASVGDIAASHASMDFWDTVHTGDVTITDAEGVMYVGIVINDEVSTGDISVTGGNIYLVGSASTGALTCDGEIVDNRGT